MSHSNNGVRAEGVIAVSPLPTPRPKVALRGRYPVAYYPKKYNDYYDSLVAMIEALNLPTFSTPVSISADFFIEKARTSKLTEPKADIDNLLKGLMDSLQKAGVLEDDKIVVELRKITKQFGEPRIAFTIEAV